MKLNPVIDFMRYHYRFFGRYIEFNKEIMSNDALESHNNTFRTFLKVVYTRNKAEKTHAVLIVTFKVDNMSFFQKNIVPILSIPFFAGAPGFISKSFMINEHDNAFQGFYEWECVEDAQRYISSYPLSFMKKIAISNSVNYEISHVNQFKGIIR